MTASATPDAPPLPPPRPIRFVHQGRIVSVEGLAPTTSVLAWLREHAHCTGTKEGCAEGDCGACTVVIAEPAPAGTAPAGSAGTAAAVIDGLLLRTVNACIQFLPTLDGRALLTVEDLKAMAGGALHPVQQALVDCHGSQCGFCTPGFAMSLACAYEHHQAAGTRPGRQALADALAGNLCRCTGYRPILDAGQRMFDAPPVRLDTAALKAQLAELALDAPLHYAGPSAAASASPPGRIDHLHAPRTLDELAALRLARPDARLLAGATDIGLWVNKQFRDLGDVIYLGRVDALKRIEVEDGHLVIGAGAALEDAWAALVRHRPELRELWLRFASPPIRHAGTLGGNLANGSPIGDGAPALIALDARLWLRKGAAVREVALDAFYVDYMRNDLAAGEFVQAIVVPLPGPQQLRVYKVSKRYDSDISAVCAGLALSLDGDGRIAHVRLAYGGMAATVRRAAQAEAALLGQPWGEPALHAAQAALAQDFTPLSDMRASAAYRLRVAQNLLRRFWLETRAEAPLAQGAVSVWALDEATS
ncbi:MAG: xanthine dehydrogenase small subunit [Burkholderiales bacterium]|nr:xanthine dehydrogenase small subunit [Burkholderiales bacterium]